MDVHDQEPRAGEVDNAAGSISRTADTAASHPLDLTTEVGLAAVREILAEAGLLTELPRWAFFVPEEPAKSGVLAHEPGVGVGRGFHVVLRALDTRAARDAVVSVTHRSIGSVVEVYPACSGQPPIIDIPRDRLWVHPVDGLAGALVIVEILVCAAVMHVRRPESDRTRWATALSPVLAGTVPDDVDTGIRWALDPPGWTLVVPLFVFVMGWLAYSPGSVAMAVTGRRSPTF